MANKQQIEIPKLAKEMGVYRGWRLTFNGRVTTYFARKGAKLLDAPSRVEIERRIDVHENAAEQCTQTAQLSHLRRY